MAEVEIEAFEITDYDLENEFNPNRRRHRLTKQQQIYGVFAPQDDSGDERPGFGRKDFTAPINFVGGGIQQAGKKPVEAEQDEEVDVDESSSSDEERIPVTRRSSWIPPDARKTKRSDRRMPVFRGGMEDEFGKWEKYTKGVGLKLLLKQGYKPGKGLGKELQGIAEPIEAKQRKGRGAIGAYGTEKTPQQLRKELQAVDNEGEEKDDVKPKSGQWKKSEQQESKKKIKYVYKTMDEVISEGSTKRIKGDTSQLSKVKVIDMTGPEQRILSGYHAIHSQHSKPQEADEDRVTKNYQNFALPELMHNLDLLVSMTEEDIIQHDREVKYQNDQIVNMKHEEEKLMKILKQEEREVNSLERILKIVLDFEERSKTDKIPSLKEVASTFHKLREDFYEEYKMYELTDLALSISLPLLKKYFESWNPFKDPSYGLNVMSEWKDLLEEDCSSQFYANNNVDPYHKVFWDCWMPPLRSTVLNWNFRNCIPVIELVENWIPLIPSWIIENILDQVILPRLQTQVEEWNPLTDEVPIHSWIHPWLPIMGTRLEVLYPTIRQKLANGLTQWQPHDPSAKRMLEPWRNVFPPGAMEAFVTKNVLPKIAGCLNEFVVNPHQQILDPWHWFMAWEDMLPLGTVVSVLERNFFPKWLHVLCAWLGQNPNYDEITKWYMGWKSMFSEKLQNHPAVREQFSRALDVMNHAVSMPQNVAYPQDGRVDHAMYLAELERRRAVPPTQPPLAPSRDFEFLAQSMQNPNANLTMSFKDLVARRAMENGIVFVPVPNRYQEAKQVYQFGPLYIYLDRTVIFVLRDHSWLPISLQALVDMIK